MPILEEARDKTGLGHTFLYRRFANWSITSKKDAAGLVAIFDRYPLRAKKARDFAVWKEAVELWQTRERGPVKRGADRANAMFPTEARSLLKTGKEIGIRQVDLADLFDVEQSTISRVLRSPPTSSASNPVVEQMRDLAFQLAEGRRALV